MRVSSIIKLHRSCADSCLSKTIEGSDASLYYKLIISVKCENPLNQQNAIEALANLLEELLRSWAGLELVLVEPSAVFLKKLCCSA